jgi:hypothetical protein
VLLIAHGLGEEIWNLPDKVAVAAIFVLQNRR